MARTRTNRIIYRGSTSVILHAFIERSDVTTGEGKAGLAYNTSGLNISVIRPGESTATTYTSGSSNVETISTLGTYAAPTSGKCRFKEVDSTNCPGLYEIHLADALFDDTGSLHGLKVVIHGVTNVSPAEIDIQLTGANLQSAVRICTALPNVASGSDGGVMLSGASVDAALKSLTISNSAGSALTCVSTGSNGSGLVVTGNGSGSGVLATAGATGHGSKWVGGSTSGHGLFATTTAGDGIRAFSASGNGIYAEATIGDGVEFVGGTYDINADIHGSMDGSIGSLPTSETRVIRAGTCQSGSTSTTIKLDSGASATNDYYRRRLIKITGGTGAGQAEVCASYNGSTKVATMDKAWTTTPDNTSVFSVEYGSFPNINTSGQVTFVGTTISKSGTIDDASPTATQFDASGLTNTSGYYQDQMLVLTSGTMAGHRRAITTTTVNGGKLHFVVAAFPAAPANGTTFEIV
jgi:hypothetical protein